jgi:flagellin-like protein
MLYFLDGIFRFRTEHIQNVFKYQFIIFFMKKRERAQSEVLTAAILIVVVMVIAAIVWSFASGYLQKQTGKNPDLSLYYGAKISDAQISPVSELNNGPIDSSTATEKILLYISRTDNEGTVSGIIFNFNDELGNSYSYQDLKNPPNDPGIVQTYEITNKDLGIQDFSKIKKITVRLLSGNGNPTDILDTYIIP